MLKRILCLCVIFTLLLGGLNVLADSKNIYTDIKVYQARIFVCDTQKQQVVLVNVAPIKNPYMLNQAPHLEYKALDINKELIFGSKGQNLSLEVINGYLLDSTVCVLVGRNGYGYKVISMQFR